MAELGTTEHKHDQIGEYKAFSNPISSETTFELDGCNYEMWYRTFMIQVTQKT